MGIGLATIVLFLDSEFKCEEPDGRLRLVFGESLFLMEFQCERQSFFVARAFEARTHTIT